MSFELPRDAEGREIPLDTEHLYMKDGTKQNVDGFMFSRKDAEWSVETHIAIYDTEELYLTPPDSWEKLEEDLSRASGYDIVSPNCRYFTAGKCVDCRMRNGTTCGIRKNERAFADILERIRKLRGDTDAD